MELSAAAGVRAASVGLCSKKGAEMREAIRLTVFLLSCGLIAKALKANSKAWEFFASWRPPTDVTSSFGFTQLNDWKRAKGAFANRSHCWRPEKSLA